MGSDVYTKLLLHCDGADGSTTFIDSATGKAITAVGTAQVDTAQSKFGGASLLLDGNSDLLTTASHADFDFGAGDFTIDFWIRFNNIVDTEALVAKKALFDTYAPINIMIDTANLTFRSSANGTSYAVNVQWAYGGNIVINTWYHVACVRYGNLWSLYVNGISKASATVSQTVMTNTTAFTIGANANASYPTDGRMDEVRVSKGIARWTANFAPPYYAYDTPSGGILAWFMNSCWAKHDKLWRNNKLYLPKDLGFQI